jgi:HlyD family secretion protein
VVLEVAKRSVGSVVREAEPLFTLVPLDAPLEAEVQIGADDIGVVRLGDPARLKFDAFPFQRHGTVQAELAILSEDAFLREAGDAASKPAEKGSEAFYRGRLNLGQNELRQLGSNPRLLPGMTLTAEIVIGQRSVISYLLYPVMKGLDEALREP